MFGDFQKDTPAERNVRFGVREHGMRAICNGIALPYCPVLPYKMSLENSVFLSQAAFKAAQQTHDGRYEEYDFIG
ncbi:hypothetical protein RIF29_16536 [Crotalaria pallida]|uniref:Uncharacterized protein n=1 Tax=Crotalaria pallida TaxID=3830 RepID=A0AAN9FGR8_CROPI